MIRDYSDLQLHFEVCSLSRRAARNDLESLRAEARDVALAKNDFGKIEN